MSEAAVSADDFYRKRRTKNIAIGLTVAGVCVLFFLITLIRLAGH